ncbi:transporter substrate-binding domain-containing protein [Deltaproteobacteria bacterium TL4]
MKAKLKRIAIRKYVFLLAAFTLSIPSILFSQPTDDEKNGSLPVRLVKTIIVDNYYPYTFVNAKGNPDGFSLDLAKAVAKVMGLNLEITANSWDQAQKALKAGIINFLPMMAYSKERDKIFDFSTPHTIAYDAFFTRKNHISIESIEDLKGKKVIVMKHDQAHDYLLSSSMIKYIDLKFIDNLPDALRLLSSGEVDAALMPKLVGLIHIRDLNLNNLEPSPLIVEEYNRPFSFAVKKGNQELLGKLSFGLSILKATGQYNQLYNKWFGTLEPKGLSLKEVLKYIIGVMLVFALIGILLILWTFSLKKQVAIKTESLQDEIYVRKRAEERLKMQEQVLNNLVEGVNVFDENALLIFTNPAFDTMFQYEDGELIGKHCSLLNAGTPEEKKQTTAMIMEQIHKTGYWRGEIHNQKKDGTPFLSFAQMSAMEIAGKKHWVTIQEDITKRKQAENELKAEKEFSENILQSSPDTIYVYDPHTGKPIRWNNAQSEITGYSHEEIASMKTVKAWYSQEEIKRIAEELGKLNQGKKITVALNQLCKDGRSVSFEYRAQLVKDEDGNPKYVVAIGRDVSERNKLEKQLRQSQKMEAIGTLAGGIAHDFNNLLVPILGYAEMTQTLVDPKGKEFRYLGNIMESADRAKDLVKKILIITRSSVGNTEAVQLKNLVDEVLTVLLASIPATIEIHQEIDFDLPLVSADPSQIYQVILNLCNNAVQAMPGKGELWIRLNRLKSHQFSQKQELIAEEEMLCLSVQDNGCGMDSATLERIYEPFFTTKEKGAQRGTGLGLSIVSSVVKQHKGHIEVESTPGLGTIFRVYFPVLKMKETPSQKEAKSAFIAGNEHILLVDDDKMVNEMGTTILTGLGYRVTHFADSLEAFEAFQANPQDFRLVITDYSMPHLTGPQLMEKMKAIRPDIPILLITGYTNLETPENLEEWGCDGIISKPYELKKLSRTVSQILAKAKRNR